MAPCNFIIILVLSILLASCSTGHFGDMPLRPQTKADYGVRYLLGRGVEKDPEKAFYYFSQAAQEDDPFAENELAYLYAAGKGTKRDYSKAFYWYEKAAQHGLASAQFNLGLMYAGGIGIPQNRSLALSWFQKAAANGFAPAKQALLNFAS